MVVIRAEGLQGRYLVCLRACKKHTGESNGSALSLVLRMTQTSFPFPPLHLYCLQKHQNKGEINRSFPCQQASEIPWKPREGYWCSLCKERARHLRNQSNVNVRCCIQMQGKVSHPKRLILLFTLSQLSSVEDVKSSGKQKGNRTISELKIHL